MPPPHHASIPARAWAVPLLAGALVALKLAHIVPSDDTYVLVLAGLFLGATVFAAVHHAEVLALKLGEPFGSILLAVAVTVIEAGLIVSIMLAGAEGSERVARDTVFAAVMIVLNGVVGLCLVLGAGKHFEQTFQLQGAASALAVLGTLATLALILPNFAEAASGPPIPFCNWRASALCRWSSGASSCSCKPSSIAIISSTPQATTILATRYIALRAC